MKRNQTAIRHNGKQRFIRDFAFYDFGSAEGIISGEHVNICGLPKGATAAQAKHALVDAHDSVYGDKVMTKRECGKRGAKVKYKAINVHVERLPNGMSRATGEVDGVMKEIFFEGRVVSSEGDVRDAKPWLKDVRADLVDKGKEIVKPMRYCDEDYVVEVDSDFIEKFRSAGFYLTDANDGIPSVRIGHEYIKLKGSQYGCLRSIEAAIRRYNDHREEKKKKIDNLMNQILKEVV